VIEIWGWKTEEDFDALFIVVLGMRFKNHMFLRKFYMYDIDCAIMIIILFQ